ncbi:MAG: hypothetical protein G01um10145_43 [Microgenomates group bacterium Gr01-1014_5]|nr:MAG: hypothetical protein G01um10145_43 [Microgenomates group bacterium Gr01-1014_5]
MLEQHVGPKLLTYSKEWATYTDKYTAYLRFINKVVGSTSSVYTQFEYTGIFLALLENSDNNPQLRNLRGQIETAPNPSTVAQEALTCLPFDGIRIMEIGGPFGQILHAMGAEVWCVDPDIEGESGWQKLNWTYSPTSRAHLYHAVPHRITFVNWETLIRERNFDAIYSSDVLSTNSGASSDWRKHLPDFSGDYHEAQAEWVRVTTKNKSLEALARKEIFLVSALASKKGGLVMHKGDALAEIRPIAPEAGLDLIEKRFDYLFDSQTRQPYDGAELLVFRKQRDGV